MNIVQNPSGTCLAGNLKTIIISAQTDVSVTLSTGGQTVVAHTYTPSDDNRIIIDLKDIVTPLLSFSFPDNGTNPCQQTAIVKQFNVSVSEIGSNQPSSFSFKAVRAGIDNFSGNAEDFLEENFLTWQPTRKEVTYYTPEYLTYYAVQAAVIKAKIYWDGGSTTVTLKSGIGAGECWTVCTQYAYIAGLCSPHTPLYYDVWAEDTSGNRLSYVQRYVAADLKAQEEQWVLFENSLGGLDTFRAYGDCQIQAEHTHNVAEIEDIAVEYRIDTTRKYRKNTGLLGKYERKWLLDFFPATGKYICVEGLIRRIVVVESDVSYSVKTLPSAFAFTFRFADAKQYLNLPRVNLPVSELNIQAPQVGSFTVAPRLAEFPQISPSGGALIPVQMPAADAWAAVSIAALAEYFALQALSTTIQQAGAVFLGLHDTADKATKLETARTIWGHSFDGTANIDGALTGVTGILLDSGDIAFKETALTHGNIRISYDSATKTVTIESQQGGAVNLSASGTVKSGGNNCEVVSNKVTSLSSQSTDTQYPSAKCVYDLIGDIAATLDAINGETIP